MDQYITGKTIKELRERKKITQSELAEKLNLSPKTISKWETGKGYPDITLLETIAQILGVSLAELFSGNMIHNMNVSANVLQSKFYICPVCGNVIHSMGEASISCHGILLQPETAEQENDQHHISVENIEDEYYVCVDHPMSKQHYISFIAAVSTDGIQFKKLYPEGSADGRFKMNGVREIFYYCNREGLFCHKI